MKTRISPLPFSRYYRGVSTALAALGLTVLPSCVKEDDVLQSQIIETRAAMEQRGKELEQAQSQLSELKDKMQRMSGSSGSSDEVAKLKARNTELESQLAAARQQTGSSEGAVKFDLDAMASKLEDDLTRKAKQLRELVQKQTPGSKVDEISLKALEYPPQLLSTFSSAITFNIVAENGQRLRLLFPVTADLGGTWKLPAPAEVQAAYKQAQSQPQGLAANPAGESSSPAPAPSPSSSSGRADISSIGGGLANAAATTPAPQRQSTPAPAASGGHSGMRQLDANTFAFSWGDGNAARNAAPAPAPAPAAQPPSPSRAPANAPIANFSPPASGSAPAPAPSAPPRAAAPGPAAPPPAVMPVQQDITIRFD